MEDVAAGSGRGCPEDYRPHRRSRTLWQKASIRERTFDGGRREYRRLHPHSTPKEIESYAIASDIYAGGCTAIAFTLSRWLPISTDSQHLAIRTPKWRIIPSTSSTNPTRLVPHNPPGFTFHALSLFRSPSSITNTRTVNLPTELSTLGYQDHPFSTHPYHVQGFPNTPARRTHLSYTEFPPFHHSRPGFSCLQGLAEYHRF